MPGVTFAPDLQPGKVNMRETENKTIVVIDDNEDFRNFTGTILRFEGFEVIEASNGREGMARIRNTMPDLILCDIEMADMNGIELYKGLRKDKVLRKIPFVFITAAQVENTYIRELAALDHFEILKKPFGLQELLDCTHRHLGVEHSIRLN
jgi:CheY-like chemotaxis protein